MAKTIEQNFLDQHFGSGMLFNLSPDATVAFKGLTHSSETKAKIGSANFRQLAGVPKTPEHRAKIGAANKGKAGPSPETTEKIVAARSRAVAIDGKIYSSLSEAARQFDTTPTTVYDRIGSNSMKFKNWKYV
jgi:hypothetical protein